MAGRSVGYVFRASLHAYGGTFDSVTCHQRRYHYARLRIVAGSRAVGCMQRWCCSLCRRPFTSLPTDNPGAPAAWLPASRTYLLALFTCRNVSHGETHFRASRLTETRLAVRFCERRDPFTLLIFSRMRHSSDKRQGYQ